MDGLIWAFWISVGAIFWAYIGYPVLLEFMAPGFRTRLPRVEDFPRVDVVFAAHNEEAVIEQKIRSIYNGNYPIDKLKVYVGSDVSTDRTDEIVEALSREYPNLYLLRMPERTGKSGIINHLVKLCDAPFVLGTDANIFFDEDMIPRMMEHMADPKVHLVGGNIRYRNMTRAGIATEETMYLSFENRIKQLESDIWNIVLGVEGGCYLIRKEAFVTIPGATFMEDFFLTMSVLRKKGRVRFESTARCTEDVSVLRTEEFKRKVRISIGNFQNLRRFRTMLIRPFWPVGFAFFSHKLLRWMTPLFLLTALLSSAALMLANVPYYLTALVVQLFLLLLFAIDGALDEREDRPRIVRFVGHFYLMNFALLIGLVKYLQGVKNNVWQPTKRAQKGSEHD